MSVDTSNAASKQVAPKPDEITLTIDGVEVSVPKGTLLIRAAEKIGVAIPRFCDHPLLDPVGACRQCLVEIPDMGNGRGMPKPQASCTVEVANGMKVSTQISSPVAAKAQKGMLEFLLINHPLDCPICDKGGECPLQNQALSNGPAESRYHGVKRTYPKPVNVSQLVLLDRERCVLCARCTRFSEQISGDPFIALVERGALQQIGIYEEHPYNSYFSGNVIQICPVGALTSADYRFQSRPFDLVSVPTTCEVCASGCSLRTDQRHYQVKRRLAGNNPDVNEEWSCDKGRFSFFYGRQGDRITTPLVRRGDVLEPANWAEAIDAAVQGLRAAGSSAGVLTGGRLTVENAYAYSRFARAVLGTNNIDCRARTISDEETGYLGAAVAGRALADSVTYADLQQAKRVVLVSFEPEDESPIVFLRLRKAVRKNKLQVITIAPLLSNGSAKLSATLIPTAPGGEATALRGLDEIDAGTIVLVGERAATSAGALSAAAELTKAGARVAWIPRRAGEVGAIDAGCLPTVLPGGRPVTDAAARVDVQSVWGVESLPSAPGLDTDRMLAAAGRGELQALVVAGVQLDDLADPDAARDALDNAGFVVSLEQRASEVTERADVVFPVAMLEEQWGTFHSWEHRPGPVNQVNAMVASPMTDLRVLAALADALGTDLGVRTNTQAMGQFAELGDWDGARATVQPALAGAAASGSVVATWRRLLDGSRVTDGSTDLLQTAPAPVIKVSRATAERHGYAEGTTASVAFTSTTVTAPVEIVEGMADGVVWVPSGPGVRSGAVVDIKAGGAA